MPLYKYSCGGESYDICSTEALHTYMPLYKIGSKEEPHDIYSTEGSQEGPQERPRHEWGTRMPGKT